MPNPEDIDGCHSKGRLAYMEAVDKLPWYLNFTNWFIIAGVVGGAILLWGANGWAGIPLKDGNYTCETAANGGLGDLAGFNPSVTVADGQPVSVTYRDLASGTDVEGTYSSFKRTSPDSLTIVSSNAVYAEAGDSGSAFNCTWYDG
jgi:hypothetical protein